MLCLTRWLTWTTALLPVTSNTCPLRLLPSGNVSVTISAYLGNFWSTSIKHKPTSYEIYLP